MSSASATSADMSSSAAVRDLRAVNLKDYLNWATAPLGQVVKGRLIGKVAVVTGASAGIGAVTARRLAAEGAKVVLSARREEPLQRITDAIKKSGGEAVYLVSDASKENDQKKLVEFAVKTYGGLNIAFNNAGALKGMGQKPWEIESKVFEEQLAANLHSVFYGIKYQSTAISNSGGGVIVNTASVLSLQPVANFALYSASKSWVYGYTRHVTTDLAKIGVRVNSVSPGFVLTDIAGGGEQGLQVMNSFASVHATGRIVKPEDVAGAVAYLASEDGKGITGADFLVDGGAAVLERVPGPSK